VSESDKPICMANFIRRATVRHLRLHACASMRLKAPKRRRQELLWLLEVAERYADGEINVDELKAARAAWPTRRLPVKWRNDFDFAFQQDGRLRFVWDRAAAANRTIQPDEPDYHFALPRYRLFEELIGPDPLPPFSPDWRTNTVLSLARTMYESRDFGAIPILADALQDAGCDNDAILSHCRSEGPHVRGCWVLDVVLGK
jgi:hypothetical protein